MDGDLCFDVQNLAVWRIGSLEIWVTETMVTVWIIIALMILFALWVRIKVRSFTEVPSTRLQNAMEAAVEGFEKFMINVAGEKLTWLGGWFFTVFSFLIIANMSGLVPGVRPPTADWPLPFALAFSTVIMVQVAGLRHRKLDYLRGLCSPIFLFLPLNLISEFSRSISLSFRLFGNVIAGMIIVTLVYSIAPLVVQLVLPVVLHAYFDVLSGILQAFIFTVLSFSYLGLAVATEE